ncbi:MAG: 4-aminobutyrate--2-oxoglutarate transaminase [Firmicutes bacterium]|nr:4-aminobutyrate--2-oxoglutarate transaminase [Bacillota bacterium]
MAIPGPRSIDLMRRRQSAIPRGVSQATPIFVERAEGAKIWDVDGNEYLDFAGGIGVQNLGHRADFVVAAVKQQLDRYIHTSINVVPYEPYIELAERLAAITAGDWAKKVLFINSGAEAVENAVKIARSYTKRSAIVAFRYGFHGRTLLTMTLTGKAQPYRADFGPMAPEIYHVAYPYPYRDPLGHQENFGLIAANRLLELFQTEIAGDQVAAVIVEPVAGEGGFLVPPKDFLPRLREITSQYGILLIADEIQTGFGRTGTLFACEHSGVEPDLITVAKSLAAGLPLSAVIGRAEIMDAPSVGGLGGTYGGNPLALAAALAVVKALEQDSSWLERAKAIGERVARSFESFHQRYQIVGEARGLGAMQALELVDSQASRQPSTRCAEYLAQYAYEHGLILMRAGMENHVIRTLMPLVISDEELDQGLEIMDRALAYASQKVAETPPAP